MVSHARNLRLNLMLSFIPRPMMRKLIVTASGSLSQLLGHEGSYTLPQHPHFFPKFLLLSSVSFSYLLSLFVGSQARIVLLILLISLPPKSGVTCGLESSRSCICLCATGMVNDAQGLTATEGAGFAAERLASTLELLVAAGSGAGAPSALGVTFNFSFTGCFSGNLNLSILAGSPLCCLLPTFISFARLSSYDHLFQFSEFILILCLSSR